MPLNNYKYPKFYEEAYIWAIEHSSDEVTANEIEDLAEKQYEWICNEEGVEPYEQ